MDNKSVIMKTALELFYQKGYDAVGIQEIVDKAGITKPTLYYYFGSKLGLLGCLLKTEFDLFREGLMNAAAYQGNVPDTLFRVAGYFIDYAVANREVYMLMMALFYSARENEAYQAVQPLMHEFYGMIVKVFDEARTQLGNMRGRQKQFALGFIGILSHYIIMVCGQGNKEIMVSNEVKQELVRQFMYGIYS